MSIACAIEKFRNEIEVCIYDIKTGKEPEYSRHEDESFQKVIDELFKKYKNRIGIITLSETNLEPNQMEKLKKTYGNLLHVATEEELNFDCYLKLTVDYSVGDFIIKFAGLWDELLECTEVTDRRIKWKKLDEKEHKSNKRIDFEYVERMFKLKMNQVHAIFHDSQKKINSLYGSELEACHFKSINFRKNIYRKLSILSRLLLRDPEVSILVESCRSSGNKSEKFIIKDDKSIHIPKLVKEYDSRTDIMGIDLGSTRCVLAVSRKGKIQIVPFDNSSPGDLWTEFVVSFDGKKPIIGQAAVRRIVTKPDYVIFDTKVFTSNSYKYLLRNQNNNILPFKLNIKDGQPYLESMTSEGLKQLSFADINSIFLERMLEAASKYQGIFNEGNPVKKAVISVPKYFNSDRESHIMIPSVIEAAKSANVEIIDIIEETHADLLYYLSHEEYSEMIKPEMKVAIFDIGGGTCICKIYEILQQDNEKYASCLKELLMDNNNDVKFSGRDIDHIIIKKLEKSIPQDLISKVRLRTLEAAKKIKHDLSFENAVEFKLSGINSRIKETVEFTREWFEDELRSYFSTCKIQCKVFKSYSSSTRKEENYDHQENRDIETSLLFDDVNFVFLAGGTCRIPFISKWINEQFPKAEVIISDELEVITATGAAVHALQVLSGEVEPYIKITEHHNSQSDSSNEQSYGNLDEESNNSDDNLSDNEESQSRQYHFETGTSSRLLSRKKDNFAHNRISKKEFRNVYHKFKRLFRPKIYYLKNRHYNKISTKISLIKILLKKQFISLF